VHIYNQSENFIPGNSLEYQKAGWNPIDVVNYADDVLYANDNFLAIHVKYPGPRHLCLPEPRQFYDVFEDKLVEPESDGFDVHCAGNSTYLYYIGRTPWKELC